MPKSLKRSVGFSPNKIAGFLIGFVLTIPDFVAAILEVDAASIVAPELIFGTLNEKMVLSRFQDLGINVLLCKMCYQEHLGRMNRNTIKKFGKSSLP